ncbi:ribosomal protein S24e family protein [Striga asiatica]|uniref:Ribosomal protein S24e family protein n=1 Tax=Striga asiatica TaxID=4170 RepID=A0A5A7RJI9_STRAF|nr:ribosomal protein S24e family protein [Striga asiatica]
MSQLSRAAVKWSRLIGTGQASRPPPSAIFSWPKLFSTEAADPSLGSSDDPFNLNPAGFRALIDVYQPKFLNVVFSISGRVYAKLTNITRHTTKTDVLHLLDECGLNPENLKVEYNLSYTPQSMMVEFSSGEAYSAGLKAINRAGRVYNMKRVDKSDWDTTVPYDGKVILLYALPRIALMDDIERFLSGCQYDSSSIEIFNRPSNPNNVGNASSVRMGLVRFPSQALATHAFITKNRGFCLNAQISVHVLH